MGVPVLGRVRDLRMAVSDGDELLLDTTQGQLVVSPNSAMEHAFESRLTVTQKRKAAYAALRDLPSVSADVQPITLLVNAGLRGDRRSDEEGQRVLGSVSSGGCRRRK